MDIEAVKRLVLNPKETPKVDFKREPYKLDKSYPGSSKEIINEQWQELIKDIGLFRI